MKKLIIHINPNISLDQYGQCLEAALLIRNYFEKSDPYLAKKFKDSDRRITARFEEDKAGVHLIMYHDQKDVCIFSLGKK